jgi:hypothetical protein
VKRNLTAGIDSSDLYISQAEHQIIKGEFLGIIKQLAPGLYNQGQELFDRISTPNWALEWGLSRWLGEAFGLPELVIHQLVQANVFLLGFVRIVDDVIDDDFQPSGKTIDWTSDELKASANDKRDQALLLGVLLQNLWHKTHVCLLTQIWAKSFSKQPADNELILSYLDAATQSLSEWINETSNQDRRPIHSFSAFNEKDFLRIGHRFAPLKTCCVTACYLAGHNKEIKPLTDAIDHILTCAVMIDDVFDWPSDLKSSRYNIFVAFCSDLVQTAAFQSANELAVLQGIYLKQKLDPFFELILQQISKAEKASMLTTCPKLRKFISCLRSDIFDSQSMLEKTTLTQIKEASNRFLSGSL